jgi:cysteine desulfurase
MNMPHTKELYLDHATTTPLHPEALGAMLPYFGNHYGSSCSPSLFGDKARRALEDARAHAANLIKARPGEIIFTSSGTEANNLAILGGVRAKGSKGKHIVTSRVEHASVLNVCRHLELEGFRVTYVPVDAGGRVDPGAVEEALDDDTLLISIMHASHAVGTLQPIREIGAMARSRGITFHVDAAQSAGRVRLSMEDLPVDLLTISSHKLYGPKGVGALYIRDNAEIAPVAFGLGQERGVRPGTENIPGIVGFGIACAVAERDFERNAMLVTSLREALEGQVLTSLGGAVVNASSAERLPHITSLSFKGVSADAIACHLEASGIIVSSTPPLGRHSEDLFPVLEAMLGEDARACGAIRLSLGWENREQEVRRTVDALKTALLKINDFSAASRGKDLVFFSLPDRESVARSFKALDNKGFPLTLIPCPEGLAYGTCSPVSLCALSDHQEAIGSALGELGIAIQGIHRLEPRSRAMTRNECAFWGKVEQIKKSMK